MEVVATMLSALLCSAMLAWLTIRFARRYAIGIDDSEASYKSHLHCAPRLGAIPILGGLTLALAILSFGSGAPDHQALFLFITLLPAFAIGLLEDVLQNLGTLIRLLMTMVSAALGWWLLDARLFFLDIDVLDPVLATYTTAAFAVTLFAASGVTHAVNIVDGYNGLSSFVSMVMLAAIAAIANEVGDHFVFAVALYGAAATLGFFVWNFPFGRLFLGDGGAYLTGLLVAELSLMLVCRNPAVSPWFPMLLAIYPIWETVHSAGRRMFVEGRSPGSPDRLHMHSLVYHRLVRSVTKTRSSRAQTLRSSLASMYMWMPALASAALAVLFWNQAGKLKLGCALFALGYLLLYRALVRFRIQRMLVRRERIEPVEVPGQLGSD